jgi:hypothetical protein
MSVHRHASIKSPITRDIDHHQSFGGGTTSPFCTTPGAYLHVARSVRWLSRPHRPSFATCGPRSGHDTQHPATLRKINPHGWINDRAKSKRHTAQKQVVKHGVRKYSSDVMWSTKCNSWYTSKFTNVSKIEYGGRALKVP